MQSVEQRQCDTAPDITVIICAYRTGERIRPTIEAVLAQTYARLKLIVIDDASGDDTAEVVKSYTDKRLRLVENAENLGIIGARNKGLSLVDTKFAATCDHDDVWAPDKIEKQIAYMRLNPACGLVGTYWTVYVNGNIDGVRTLPFTTSDYLKWQLFHRNCLLHSSLLMRTSFIREHSIKYRDGLRFADDWKLCFDFARAGEIGIVPESLVSYYIHGENWSLLARENMLGNGVTLLQQELAALFDRKVSDEEAKTFFHAVAGGDALGEVRKLSTVGTILKQIVDAVVAQNNCNSTDKKLIEQTASEIWWRVIRTSAGVHGPGFLQHYTGPDYPNAKTIGMAEFLTEWLKACAKTLLTKMGFRPRR